MKKNAVIFIAALLAAGAALGGWYAWNRSKEPAGNRPGSEQQAGTAPLSANSTNLPLSLPPGFTVSYLAQNLPGARAMVIDRFGHMWVSQAKEGVISTLEIKDGKAVRQSAVFKNLDNPHGLAIDPADGTTLYFAEEGKISRVALYSDDPGQKIADLPSGGRHTTRTLKFGPDGRLYVSIGSSCDVCAEKDERRAAIYSLNKDGSDFKKVAGGLRNAVFFAWNPVDGKMWATEMGRDFLGDNLPPDEINVVDTGLPGGAGQNPAPDYGWPICYGKNIHDTQFDKNRYVQDPCGDKQPSHIDLPAHSAPLGLDFVPEEGWPEDMRLDLLVALHGSWNRSEPAGYKVVRVKLDNRGNHQGTEDFLTGFIPAGAGSGSDALGRPVDILLQPGGIMYLSDDKQGAIYRLAYSQEGASQTGSTASISNLKENQEVVSPLRLEGQAPGPWYFEASFPVKLVDKDSRQIAKGVARAQGEWMTTGQVPFKAEIEFDPGQAASGWIVLEKDNPSGLPENAAEIRFPVRFRPVPAAQISAPCVVTGCSGQICSDREINTTCEYKEEYACYKTAKCERQANGQCGWTQTGKLKTCLAGS